MGKLISATKAHRFGLPFLQIEIALNSQKNYCSFKNMKKPYLQKRNCFIQFILDFSWKKISMLKTGSLIFSGTVLTEICLTNWQIFKMNL